MIIQAGSIGPLDFQSFLSFACWSWNVVESLSGQTLSAAPVACGLAEAQEGVENQIKTEDGQTNQ